MEEQWTFYEFDTAISDWLRSLGAEAVSFRDELWDILQRLKLLDAHQWQRPHFAPIEDGLRELRLNPPGINKAGRIYGCYGPKRKCFAMLVGSVKKGTTHIPRDAKKLAGKRRRILEGDPARARRFDPYQENTA